MQANNTIRVFLPNALTLTALTLLAGAARAQSGYTITDLGSLGGDSYGYGVNNKGQVTGVYYTRDSYMGFLSSNGNLTDLGNLGGPTILPDRSYLAANAINDSGLIVGQYKYDTGKKSAVGGFLYQNGQIQAIGLDDPQAINNAGQIVGEVGVRAALYQNGIITELNLVANSTRAFGINNNGVIVGSDIVDGFGQAFFYQNSVEHILPQISSQFRGATAYGINDNGQIVGGANIDGTYGHATLWQNGQVIDLGSFGRGSNAYAINKNGVIVGEATEANGQSGAFVYQNGQMTDLLAGSIWHDGEATAINDSGQIAGWANLPNGRIHAFLATPNAVPAPGSLLTFGLGTGMMLLAAQRRKRNAAPR